MLQNSKLSPLLILSLISIYAFKCQSIGSEDTEKDTPGSNEAFIIDILNGKIFREGDDEPIAQIEPVHQQLGWGLQDATELDQHSPSYQHQGSSNNLISGHYQLGGGEADCVTFYNTQKFCGVYHFDWASNGSAKVCGMALRHPPPPSMPLEYSVGRASLYSLLSIISLTGNCMLVSAVVVSAGLQKPVYWLLAGFSSSSMLLVFSQGLHLIPPTLMIVEQSWVLGELPCYFVHVLTVIATVASTIFILLIAFERYTLGKTPPHIPPFVTVKRSQLAIVFTWAVSLGYGCCWVVFIEFDTCVLNNGQVIDRCQLRELDIGRAVMSVTEGFFLLALPLAAAVILLVQTSAPQENLPAQNNPANQVSHRAFVQMPTNAVVSSGYLLQHRFASSPAQLSRQRSSAHSDKPFNLIRLMLFHLISYIMLASPRRLMELYMSSGEAVSPHYLTETVFYILMYLNTALFPFMVLLLSSNVRRAVRKLIKPQKTSGRLFTQEADAQNVPRRAREMQVMGGVGSRRTTAPGGRSQNGSSQGSSNGQVAPPQVSVSFIHVSPSGNNLNRLSSASISRSTSSNGSYNRHSSSSTDSMHSYDPNNDDVFFSFAPPAPRFVTDSSSATGAPGNRRNLVTPVRVATGFGNASSSSNNAAISFSRAASQQTSSSNA